MLIRMPKERKPDSIVAAVSGFSTRDVSVISNLRHFGSIPVSWRMLSIFSRLYTEDRWRPDKLTLMVRFVWYSDLVVSSSLLTGCSFRPFDCDVIGLCDSCQA